MEFFDEKLAKGWYGIFFVAVTIGFIAALLFKDRIDWDRILEFFHPWWGQSVGIVIATTIAVLLYALRERRPYYYAFLEMAVAEIVLWTAFGSTTASNLERGVKISAGIYLFVRALDNWKRARKTQEASIAASAAKT